jgi:hypothetical protein
VFLVVDAPNPILLVLAAVCSGCLADDGAAPGPKAATWPTLDLEVTDCIEGGSYVTWNAYDADRNFPHGFVPADVLSDLGDPPINSIGQPQEGDILPGALVTGAYHPLVQCATWATGNETGTDLLLALVGGRIEVPAFDLAPVPRQYLAFILAANEPAVVEALESAGYHAEALTDSTLALEGDVLRTVVHFSQHGDVYAAIPAREDGAKASETIRFWHLSADEGGAQVKALDFVDEGGTRLVASAPGYFEHLAGSTQPPIPGAPLHSYTTWMLGYTGFTRSLVAGPVVILEGDGAGHGH